MEEILRKAVTIAVVGLSEKPEKASYQVAAYLIKNGYKVIPVNPNIREWNGIRSYKSLLEIEEKVDVVDIFRKSEFVPGVVDDAIKIRASVVWMQLGIVNEEAAKKAEKSGIAVIMNHCIKIEHQKHLNYEKRERTYES
ncbi:CoA-binding protein [Candidatus Micrarchaeota archaeon]|nr:CoA-binding protein [Candidatus Micrarchaeota archaeon]